MKVQTPGLPASTVPCSFAVSGPPPGFLLFSGSFAMSVECFVSVFDSPDCFPDCCPKPPDGFDGEACKHESALRYRIA